MTPELIEKRISLFEEHLSELLDKLMSEKIMGPDLKKVKLNMWIDLWSIISEKYQPILEKYRNTINYKNHPRKTQIDNNFKPPSPERLHDLLSDPDIKLTAAKSPILEKTAIAYCVLLESYKYDESWLIERLSDHLRKQTALKNLLKNENNTYYLLYFSNEKHQIEYSIIEVDNAATNEDNVAPVWGVIYDNFPKEKDGLKGKGKMTDTGRNLFFEFEIKLGKDIVKSLIVVNNQISNSKLAYFFGTYCTTRRNGTPVCGVAVLEKHPSQRMARMAMHNKQSPRFEIIKNILYHKRIVVLQDSLEKLNEHKDYLNADIGRKNYAGLYRIKYISVNQNKLFEIYGLVDNSGEISVKFPTEIKPFKGIFKSLENDTIINALLGYDFNKCHFRTQVVLRGAGKNLSPGEYLEGVYGGIGFTVTEPSAGRVSLEYIHPYKFGESEKIFNTCKSKVIFLKSGRDYINGMKPEEREFFWGNKDTFIETQSYLKQFGFSEEHETWEEKVEKRLAKLEAKPPKKK